MYGTTSILFIATLKNENLAYKILFSLFNFFVDLVILVKNETFLHLMARPFERPSECTVLLMLGCLTFSFVKVPLYGC